MKNAIGGRDHIAERHPIGRWQNVGVFDMKSLVRGSSPGKLESCVVKK
jgi:hypothetical protein